MEQAHRPEPRSITEARDPEADQPEAPHKETKPTQGQVDQGEPRSHRAEGEAPEPPPNDDTPAVTLEEVEKNAQREAAEQRQMPRPRPVYGTPRHDNPYW